MTGYMNKFVDTVATFDYRLLRVYVVKVLDIDELADVTADFLQISKG